MPRLCVIDVAGLSSRVLQGLHGLWLQSLPSPPRPMEPTFPAVAASVQASMTTGVVPGVHGVIAGGIFRRQCRTFSLGERSNTLLNRKRFWHAHDLRRRKVSLVFWSNPLAGAADVVIGACTYGPVGEMIADNPVGLYRHLAGEIGEFDTRLVRGPRASWRANEWIVAAAEALWRTHKPDLQWVYMPGLNFDLVRHGIGSPQAQAALRSVDSLAQRLAETVARHGGQTIVVSDGGYVPVARVAYPNVALREAGLLKVKATDEGEVLDLENSRAFALVDHQIAHVYCDGEDNAVAAQDALQRQDGIAEVLPREELFAPGLGHDRAGERIVLAFPNTWLCYRWWADRMSAPTFATQADSPGKCGYDPCELFAGAQEGTINPHEELILASRGLLEVLPEDQCVLAATCGLPIDGDVAVTRLPEIVQGILGQ